MPPLRLFLLHSVLFPGQTMQLVVFEQRYHQLVHECLDSGEPFGVALIREGPEVGGPAVPYSVGTTARIRKAQRLPDGRMAIEVVGERRFRVRQTSNDRAYVSADVEYLGEHDEPIEPAEIEEVRATYRHLVRLRQAGAGEYERAIAVPSTAGPLADAVGALQLGTATQRQRVLEAEDPATRLRRAAELMQLASPGVQRQTDIAIAQRARGERLN